MKTTTLMLLCLAAPIWCQTTLEAETELLARITIGVGANQATIYMHEEGYQSPKGPLVGQDGTLVFLPSTTSDKIQVFRNGKFTDEVPPENLPIYEIRSRQFSSSGGLITTNSSDQLLVSARGTFYYDYYEKLGGYLGLSPGFSAPFGAIAFSGSKRKGLAIVFDVKNPKADFEVIREDRLKAWLPTQAGGFSIGEDGLLYREGFLWYPPSYLGDYGGKLLSGHDLWFTSGSISSPRYVVITNSLGKIELTVEFPWAAENNGDTSFNPYTAGTGPWGELYCLVAPLWNKNENIWFKQPPGATAELVVVRNHQKYFGRLNDGGVRLRKDPTTTGQILGTFPAKTGFRILETGTKQETIGGQKNVWYKVRLLDGKEGWVFGAFVQNLYDGPNGKAPPWPNVPDW